jgi:hypothetical protein
MEVPRHFVFRGSAVGLAARIRRPYDGRPPAKATVCLSGAGGEEQDMAGRGRRSWLMSLLTGDEKLTPEIRFAQATAYAVGDYTDLKQAILVSEHKAPPESLKGLTVVHARVEGLDILGRFKAGLIEAQLISRSIDVDKETAIVPGRGKCRAEDVYIDGRKLIVTVAADVFDRTDTRDKTVATLKTHGPPQDARGRRGHEADNRMYVSIVRQLAWEKSGPHPTAEIREHSVIIKDFGTVYFGEMLVQSSVRRMCMFRADLGSPFGGVCRGAEVETDGSYWPA